MLTLFCTLLIESLLAEIHKELGRQPLQTHNIAQDHLSHTHGSEDHFRYVQPLKVRYLLQLLLRVQQIS